MTGAPANENCTCVGGLANKGFAQTTYYMVNLSLVGYLENRDP